MPRGDRTGPNGMGPMTGRAAGFCAGYSVPGYNNPIAGRGFGRGCFGGGRGFGGRGFRNRFYATGLTGWQRAAGWPGFANAPVTPPAPEFSREQELQTLKAQADYFQNSLDQIRQRIDELQAEEKTAK